MIFERHLLDWKIKFPWPSDEQVEQDLLLTRLLIELYSNDYIQNNLLFRGGTALNKLFFKLPLRYSEDLDFVQVQAQPIGETISIIRKIVGKIIKSKPKFIQHSGRVILKYPYTANNQVPMKIKIEINTREHFSILPLKKINLNCDSSWFSGTSSISTYTFEEILATKLRALYQRRKGRDLFDLFISKDLRPKYKTVMEIFNQYIKAENNIITANQFYNNLSEKMKNKEFLADIYPIVNPDLNYSPTKAYQYVTENYIKNIWGFE